MYFENSRESETTSVALKAKIALPQRNETIFLTGKKSFCKKAGEIFFLSAKKKLYAVEII